jgi:hypothetical protein
MPGTIGAAEELRQEDRDHRKHRETQDDIETPGKLYRREQEGTFLPYREAQAKHQKYRNDANRKPEKRFRPGIFATFREHYGAAQYAGSDHGKNRQ